MIKKIITSFLLIVTVVLLFAFPASAADISPDGTRESFESQSVTDDLEAVYGENFKNEEFKDVDELQIIHTMEYGYYSKDLSDYGFYIYIYAPIAKEIKNMVLFASLGANGGSGYVPYIPTVISSDGDFYKCKINFNPSVFASNLRVYNLSALTVSFADGSKKTYNHGCTYTYSGNMKGYGSPIDTLMCKYNFLEVIDLNTHFTYYRTAGSDKGVGWQNQINTVYFSVPNSYLDRYGTISKIHHKYTEYETGPMVVTDNLTFWNYLEDLYNNDEKAKFEEGHYALSRISKEFYESSVNANVIGGYFSNFWFNELYDVDVKDGTQFTYFDSPFEGNYVRLPFWFYDSSLGEREANDVCVTSDQVFDFIASHDNQFFGTYLEFKEEMSRFLATAYLMYPFTLKDHGSSFWCSGIYHDFGYCPEDDGDLNYIRFCNYVSKNRPDYYEELFSKKLDEYNNTFDLEDVKNIETLLSYDSTHDIWDRVDDFGLWNVITDKDYIVGDKTVKVYPFSVISSTDLSLNDQDFSDRYLVAIDDVNSVKSAYQTAVDNDCTLFLFRFDVSDYYTCETDIYKCDPAFIDNYKEVDGSALVCMQSYYDDFQIISLTFKKDGVETIIPVADTPDDFIGDITTPSDTGADVKTPWGALIGLLLGMVFVFIFRKPISRIGAAVGEWIINAFKKLFGFIKRLFKKE